MFEIFRERVFSASHQLREYQGRCERLHGHNWRVRVHVRADGVDAHGMILDFHELDEMIVGAISPFDHAHLNDVAPFDEINPSSENLARVICERVEAQLPDGVRMRCCDVWENERSRARYYPPGA
ncbi:MAG: 6-carboxytetrahydropterin synthase QueD [Polyangia bacterium]